MNLRLDWVTGRTARISCERYHYTHTIPKGKAQSVGVWENGKYIGCVVFSMGAGASCDGRRFGLAKLYEVAELQRVALTTHATEVSRIVRIAIGVMRKKNPGLKMLISFADPGQGHHGGIYQAGGWIYLGLTAPDKRFVTSSGKVLHPRVVSVTGFKSHFGHRAKCPSIVGCTKIDVPGKHRYVLPFEKDLRVRLEANAQPYPKRVRSDTTDTPARQAGEGGGTPTRTLQNATA